MASELLLRLHGEERERNCALKYLEARARNLVNHHWRMVEDLAKALLERQRLTGKEVGDVLRVSLQAQMQ
jgi:ATP-dependent Zn protease